MIDWVSIVHHSRRRFSDYMYVVPARGKRQRRVKQRRYSLKNSIEHRAYVVHSDDLDEYHCDDFCGCCSWNHKTRYNAGGVEEQLPPPPSPPQVKEGSQLDGVPRPNSVERILHPDATTQHILTSHETLNKSLKTKPRNYDKVSRFSPRPQWHRCDDKEDFYYFYTILPSPNTRGQNSSAATLQLNEHELHTVHRERFSRS
ncbi:discs large 1-like protein isoform X16, partial [Vespula squamosa]